MLTAGRLLTGGCLLTVGHLLTVGSTLKPVAVCSTPDPCQPVADASPGCQPAGDASPGCQPGRDALMFGAACWDRCSAVLLNYHR